MEEAEEGGSTRFFCAGLLGDDRLLDRQLFVQLRANFQQIILWNVQTVMLYVVPVYLQNFCGLKYYYLLLQKDMAL
jgi:hypothetical protein